MCNMQVDKNDVPLLIQSLRYQYGMMMFNVTFFNGAYMRFTSDQVCPSMGLMQRRPDQMQMLEAQNVIEKAAVLQWREWFPETENEVVH